MKKYFNAFLFTFFISASCISQKNSSFDSLLLEIKKISDSTKFNQLSSELQDMIANKNYDLATTYANKLLNVSKNVNYHYGTGNTYYQIGLIEAANGKKIQALINYKQAKIYLEKTNSIKKLADVKSGMGAMEYDFGNLENSATYLLDAIKDYSRLASIDSVGLSNCYNNLAVAYGDLGDFKNAKKYYFKSLKLVTYRKEMIMNNIGFQYLCTENLDSAKIILNAALKIGKKKKDTRSISQSYSLIGKSFFMKKNYEVAKKYYDSTLNYENAEQSDRIMLIVEQQMGLVHMHLNKYEEANKYLVSSRRKITNSKFYRLLLENYELSSKLDSARGNYASALAWKVKYQKLSDKRKSEASKNKINSTKARYEEEFKYLKLIDQQNKREQKSKASLFKYRILTYIVLSILFITSIFLFIIMRNRKRIQAYVGQLNESNQVKNKLFSIISHDLKNEISGLDGSLSLMKENAFSPEEFQEIIPLLSNRTHQTSILLNNLLNWSKSQMKELNANPTLFDITDVIASKFSYFKAKAEQKNIKLINKLAPTVIYADTDMFGIIAQNLIANAIKFCDSGDSVTLISEELDKHYKIYFMDTGIGIDPKNLEKLFAEDTFTTNGTQNETGTGLGLKICKELTELNKGKITVQSEVGSGSTFCVSFPKTS